MKSSRTSSTARAEHNRIFLLLALLLPLSVVLSLCCGSVRIAPTEVVSALLGKGNGVHSSIVLLARLPRTCGCVLAGAALAVSGAVIQSVLSNPLAAPNVIGVNAGAGLAVAVCSALAPAVPKLIPAAAFIGALLAVLLVLFLSERTGASRITLVLSGVAISGVFSALIDAAVTFAPDALTGYTDFRIGGFSGLAMSRLSPAVWMIAAALLIIISLSNELDLLMLGAETAASLGMNVKLYRILLLTLAAMLAGAAVSFAGLLGFVGLIVPHIMRRLVGETARALIPACALGGAVVLTLCDLLARLLFAPFELPVGIVLSLLGGPFFIGLLLRQRGGRTHD